MTVERQDGSLRMLLRTKLGIGESRSTDAGLTWSPLNVPAIRHTASRFYLGRLRSGNLLLVKHMGIDADPASEGKQQRRKLTAFISKDEGQTWQGGLMIDDRFPVSYPDAQQVADGAIHLIWDYNRSKEQEILMTTFREEDVLAATAETTARVKSQRRLISKGGISE
jgi:predicted neuraminidase